MLETQVQSLGREDPLEKEMATHSSTLAWRIPWKKEPGGLQSMGSQRVGHDLATEQQQQFIELDSYWAPVVHCDSSYREHTICWSLWVTYVLPEVLITFLHSCNIPVPEMVVVDPRHGYTCPRTYHERVAGLSFKHRAVSPESPWAHHWDDVPQHF